MQIGDENVHRVRAVMDEVFGDANFVANIDFRKTGGHSDDNVGSALDTILWYCRQPEQFKFRKLTKLEEPPPIDEKYYVRWTKGGEPRSTENRLNSIFAAKLGI